VGVQQGSLGALEEPRTEGALPVNATSKRYQPSGTRVDSVSVSSGSRAANSIRRCSVVLRKAPHHFVYPNADQLPDGSAP